MKLLKENIGKKLLDMGLGNFFYMTPKAQATKIKRNRKASAQQMKHRMKRQPMEWGEGIFANHISDLEKGDQKEQTSSYKTK